MTLEERIAQAATAEPSVTSIADDSDLLSRIQLASDKEYQSDQEKQAGVAGKAVKGATFGISERIEDAVDSLVLDIPIEEARYRNQKMREETSTRYPVGSMAAEIAGSLPTSGALFKTMSRAGYSTPLIGATEGAAYGGITEGQEGLLLGAPLGYGIGKVLSKFDGSEQVMDSAGAARRKETVGTKIDDLLNDLKGPRQEEAQIEIDDYVRAGEASDEELTKIIFDYAEREQIKANRPMMNAAEYQESQRLKQLKKQGVDINAPDFDPRDPKYADATSDLPPVVGISPMTLTKVQKHFQSIAPDLNLAEKITELIRKEGGLRFETDVAELATSDRIFTAPSITGKAQTIGAIDKWYRNNFVPVVSNLNDLVSKQVGGRYDRSINKANRMDANFVQTYLVPLESTVKIVNENVEIRNLLLDAWAEPENIGIARAMIAEIDPEAADAFTKWRAYTNDRNTQARKTLFKSQPDKDTPIKDLLPFDEEFIASQKRGETSNYTLTGNSSRVAGSAREDSLRSRTRKLTKDMKPEELAEYENPIISHSNYVRDQEQLLEITKNFGLRPSLAGNGSSSQFFEAVKNRLLSDGFDEATAKMAANTMHEAFLGGKRAPSAPVRAFMNLAYAGTLAQFKSAMLNLHDVTVAAVNTGEGNALKATQETMAQEFGKGVQDMMGRQNYGEFIRNFDEFTDDPSLLGKLGYGTKRFSDGAMLYSGFQKMDEIGKGVVLRAAVNEARQAAKSGEIGKKYGHLFDKDELSQINYWLTNGSKVKDMPNEVAELVEDLAFAKLGEQQLISAAGRPLGYLQNTNLRPLYAMSGFAIKQQALLRENVWNAARQGRSEEAAAYAAKYAAYAGFGYGIINETRNAIFKGEEFDPVDIPLGAFDQIAAAMTLNRLGDTFSRDNFFNDPAGAVLESFTPPTGYNGAIGKALVGDLEPLVYQFPALGDPIKRIMKDDE